MNPKYYTVLLELTLFRLTTFLFSKLITNDDWLQSVSFTRRTKLADST